MTNSNETMLARKSGINKDGLTKALSFITLEINGDSQITVAKKITEGYLKEGLNDGRFSLNDIKKAGLKKAFPNREKRKKFKNFLKA
jgi:hypothetical protein